MAIVEICPNCGMPSGEVRCPRCNALKVQGCTGSCTFCGNGGSCSPKPSADAGCSPSHLARDDEDHPGTPLER